MTGVTGIKTSKKVIPMIYAYSTPEIKRHTGWTKIGYTEQDVESRIKQQTQTADVIFKLEWQGNAIYEDGSGQTFKDKDFHQYLRKSGIEQEIGKSNEWFHVDGPKSHSMFIDFKMHRGVLRTTGVIPYVLRDEQERAVSMAVDFFKLNTEGEFLWNAKPRFGKTLSVYDLCKRLDARNILIVTNRPAIANSWYDDYCKFLGDESGYLFISETSAIKNAPHVLSRSQFETLRRKNSSLKCIEFRSLQDLKGSNYFGGDTDKLNHVSNQNWDLLVIDEAHEGVDTVKTDVAFGHIKRKWTLHLSGTPFKALANAKFPEEAIFNWTYADEQKAKNEWISDDSSENPYATLPRLTMYTYQMSKIIEEEVTQGIMIDDNIEEYAFDLNEFFSTGNNGRFIHDKSVDKFLEALTEQQKFPFSSPELRNELKHTLWLLNRVDSAKALYRKLKAHPVFGEYTIVLAAGKYKADDERGITKAYDAVKEAIAQNDKTITLSVGQLTTGVTIPEWTAVLMLSNISSPSLYMQAAFRAQNPCLAHEGVGEYLRKENAYVFDFDPARTLDIYEKIANDLNLETTSERGSTDARKNRVRELLNFFPVIGEDEDGSMIELDAERVLSIPRKIRSVEVVRRGFMSDLLFQNISRVFSAPGEVWSLIQSLEPVKQPKKVDIESGYALDVDDEGNVNIPEKKVIGTATQLFGEKIYSDNVDEFEALLDELDTKMIPSEEDEQVKKMVERFDTSVTKPMLEAAKRKYGEDLKEKRAKKLERDINSKAEFTFKKAVADIRIVKNTNKTEKEKELDASHDDIQRKIIEEKYTEEQNRQISEIKNSLNSFLDDFCKDTGKEIVRQIQTDKQNQIKKDLETQIKDHLRGLTRSIPSFLMAYGTDKEITLENFDKIIPDKVFEEVTGITLDQFRFLRDGGDYADGESGEFKHFDGNLFDSVVFNDSVKEFECLRKKLANYFDESAKMDIFDYIPPQKTNQIFTPKNVVKSMVDKLEENNPGCFDNDENTFVDLYMKSGLYLAEIVKRLFRSDYIKQAYPNDMDRLNHIFSKQVYGLAPTEIIFRIAKSFLLGFDNNIIVDHHNLRICNALEYADGDELQNKLEELYGIRRNKELHFSD